MTETSLAINPEPMTLSFKVSWRKERREEEESQLLACSLRGGKNEGGGGAERERETEKNSTSTSSFFLLPLRLPLSPPLKPHTPRRALQPPHPRTKLAKPIKSKPFRYIEKTIQNNNKKQDLNYYVPAVGGGWNTILRSVTGECRAARLTACMGPSGAGKSTLLKILACNIAGGVREGDLMVNGESFFFSIFGFFSLSLSLSRRWSEGRALLSIFLLLSFSPLSFISLPLPLSLSLSHTPSKLQTNDQQAKKLTPPTSGASPLSSGSLTSSSPARPSPRR